MPGRSSNPPTLLAAALCTALLPMAASGCDASPSTPTLAAIPVDSLVASDLDGKPVSPVRDSRARFVLLLFARTDCPISNRYAPEIRRLHERFAPLGVDFVIAYADPAEPPASIREHTAAFELPCRVVRDASRALARLTGATVTPEAALLTRTGDLLYRGRIDDRYADYGKLRQEWSGRDLEAALAAATSGRPVPVPRTEAVGCPIPGLTAGGQGTDAR